MPITLRKNTDASATQSTYREAMGNELSTPSLTQRIAVLAVAAAAGLATLSPILVVIGFVAQRWPASSAFVFVAFAAPVVALFLYAMQRARAGDWSRVVIVSMVAGLLALVNAIVNLISAAYANPCFEVSSCTKGPTFSYVALGVVAVAFAAAAALGIVVIPVAAGFAARRHHRAGT